MDLDERLDQAVKALHGSVTTATGDPGQLTKRRRRRRVTRTAVAGGLVAAMVFAFASVMLRADDDGRVATVDRPGSSTGTEAPAARPPATPVPPCNQPAEPAAEASAENTTTVLVYFHCKYDLPETTVRAVPRRVGPTPTVLRAAFEQLVAGPTEEEIGRGFSSIFSGAPPGLLADVALRRDGTAVIDFSTAIMDINNIATTSRMAHTNAAIGATAFQFEQVHGVVPRIAGSEEAWCDFFSVGCEPLTRSDWDRMRSETVRN